MDDDDGKFHGDESMGLSVCKIRCVCGAVVAEAVRC